MKSAMDIVKDFVAKVEEKGLRIVFFRPPLPPQYPQVTFYQVGELSDNPDDTMRSTAFTFVFDIWGESHVSCYETEIALDLAFLELPYHVQKLGAVDNDSGEQGIYRRTVTYRFHWNF